MVSCSIPTSLICSALIKLAGVVNAGDYSKLDVSHTLQDADAVFAKFFDYCFQAGPKICSFYTGKSASDIRRRFDSLLEHLEFAPIPSPSLPAGILLNITLPTIVT